MTYTLPPEERVRVAIGMHFFSLNPEERNRWIAQALSGEPVASGEFLTVVRKALESPPTSRDDTSARAAELSYGPA